MLQVSLMALDGTQLLNSYNLSDIISGKKM